MIYRNAVHNDRVPVTFLSYGIRQFARFGCVFLGIVAGVTATVRQFISEHTPCALGSIVPKTTINRNQASTNIYMLLAGSYKPTDFSTCAAHPTNFQFQAGKIAIREDSYKKILAERDETIAQLSAANEALKTQAGMFSILLEYRHPAMFRTKPVWTH